MTDKKGKRAVIINNIRSKSIEQAIFILKSPEAEGSVDPGGFIIAEAQDIINSYIRRMEGTVPDRRERLLLKKIIAGGVVLLTLVTIAVIYALLKANQVG